LSARHLAAEETRRERLRLLADGVRFAGLEELLTKLDTIQESWKEDPKLDRVAFLVAASRLLRRTVTR
jgi:hypothetical protein